MMRGRGNLPCHCMYCHQVQADLLLTIVMNAIELQSLFSTDPVCTLEAEQMHLLKKISTN